MTTSKPAEARVVAGRAKPAPEKSTKDPSVATDPPPTDPNVVLAQLVSLTQSISNLVQQNVEVDEQTNDTPERLRAVFAYDFLGVVLGRRAPSLFDLKRVTVDRGFGTLTFTGLAGATVARVRAANNTVKVLLGLQEGVPVTIDQDPDAIPDGQRIDSIVTFTALGGVPVAVGPCLGPVNGYDG
jgi:hypothetical protein